MLISALLLMTGVAVAQDQPEAEPTVAETAQEEATPASAPETPEAEAEAEAEADTEAEPPEDKTYPIRFEGQVTPDTPHFDLEVLYHEGRVKEGLELAEKRMADNPEDATVYRHVARFMYELGEQFERTDTSIDKVAWYERMWTVADAGLELTPDDPHLKFARGVAIGRYGTTRGVLASLFLAKRVEQDWTEATDSGYTYASIGGGEQLPCDVHHGLGIYYRLVPDWWIVQVLAGTRGDLDKSLERMQLAHECGGDKIRHLKELGVTKMCIGQKRNDHALLAEGKAHISKYLTLEPKSRTERIDIRHGEMLLDDPSMACEYSRDGQQDLDREKLER